MKFEEHTIELKPGVTVTIPEDASDIRADYWGGPRHPRLTYRTPVREPVIGEVVRYGYLRDGAPCARLDWLHVHHTHRFTFRTIDGVADGTFTMEAL